MTPRVLKGGKGGMMIESPGMNGRNELVSKEVT